MDGRRWGNLMFNYASLLGIARRNNMSAVLPDTFHLVEVFDINVLLVSRPQVERYLMPYRKFEEYGRRACAYDMKSEQLPEPWSTKLIGYYQSWKYFVNVEKDLREHFRFKPEVLKSARSFLARVVPGTLQGMDVTKIGVHVRRGDVLLDKNKKYGYTVATAKYIQHAMDYFMGKFPKIVFIVCSDDITWCKQTMKGDNIIFSNTNDAGVDLAILSLCDHSIVTVGSFGWWAGWLANGTTIYYDNWPAYGSVLEYHVDKKQYFPPHWIPMR